MSSDWSYDWLEEEGSTDAGPTENGSEGLGSVASFTSLTDVSLDPSSFAEGSADDTSLRSLGPPELGSFDVFSPARTPTDSVRSCLDDRGLSFTDATAWARGAL